MYFVFVTLLCSVFLIHTKQKMCDFVKYMQRKIVPFTIFIFLLVLSASFARAQDSVFTNTEEFTPPAFIPLKLYDTSEIHKDIIATQKLQQANPDSAINTFKRILQVSEVINYQEGVFRSLQNLATIYADKGMYDQFQATFQEALRVCKDRNMIIALPVIYNGLAYVYSTKGMYEDAINEYYQSVAITEKINRPRYLMSTYNNLGSILPNVHQSKQALFYLDLAEKIAREEKDYQILSYIIINKGNAYVNMEDFDKGLVYFKSAFSITRSNKFTPLQHLALTNISMIYLKENKPQEALSYLLEAQSIKGPTIPTYLNYELMAMGEAYYMLHDYKKANTELLKALDTAHTYNIVTYLPETYSTLAKVYAKTGQYEQAYKQQSAYSELNDSLLMADMDRNVNQLEVKYRTAQKDKQLYQKQLLIGQQENNIKRKNTWIGGISIGVVLLATMLSLVFALYRSNLHKQHAQAKELALLQQEQKVLYQEREIVQLKAMMQGEEKERQRLARELHDGIGGMLSTVTLNLSVIADEYAEAARVKKLNSIIDMLRDISTEVRKTAHNLMPDVLIRYNLKKALELYCDYINASNQMEIVLQFHGDLDGLDKSIELVLYRISQELLQNIIKHAKATYAALQITQHENKLSIIVEDNGAGFDTDSQTEGYGLQNLRFRVYALNGNISIMSAKGRSTTVNIQFDLDTLKQSSIA